MVKLQFLCIFALIYCVGKSAAWDSEQLEVFDVVDDVKENFYTLLNISKDASNQEIKSAFRGLSLKLHPDKNLEEDTSEQFRHLVSVYEILRSATKRKIYDEVLVNGLPNWRSAVYYYRYVRKMGFIETCIILLIILTIAQYAVKWAAYLEKKMEFNMMKKTEKRNKKVEVYVFDLPKPSMLDTLPIQIPKLIWTIITTLPVLIYSLVKSSVAVKLEAKKPPPVEPVVEVPRVKTVRKRNKFSIPEGPNFESPLFSGDSSNPDNPPPPTATTGGFWTDDDLAELIRLVKKYPPGSGRRWESIAEALDKTVPMVTYMAAKMKENGYRLPSEQEEVVEIKVKQKTKKDDLGDGGNWSQGQQKALEEALLKFPKGCAERWDRVSSCVPHKSKEECMLRFKFLAESLKKQRANDNNESDCVNVDDK